MLSDLPNVYGDLSAASGWNSLVRDEEWTREFLDRHRDKLLFGSDCLHGGLDGPECWANQTLSALRRLSPSTEVLNKILWENGRQLLKI